MQDKSGSRLVLLLAFLVMAAILWPMAMVRAVNYANHVVINEFELNPLGKDGGKESVELFNPTSSPVDVNGWKLRTQTGGCESVWVSASGHLMMVPGVSFLVLTLQRPGMATCLNDGGDRVTLLDSSGRKVDGTPMKSDSYDDGRSWQRMPDGAADNWEFKEATPGSQNDPNTTPIPEFSEVIPVLMVMLAASSTLMRTVRHTESREGTIRAKMAQTSTSLLQRTSKLRSENACRLFDEN